MLPSYYLPPEGWRAPFVLKGQEARHLLKVMRTRTGQKVRLFDGQGREGFFRLDSQDADSARLSLQSQGQQEPLMPEVHLALAWSKSLRRGWLLEKTVEFGAAGLVFWQAQRSQGRVPDAPKKAWHEQCVAAAKQCGNARLPRLKTLGRGARELIENYGHFSQRALLWEDHDAGALFDPAALARSSHAVLVLGPEGGLTPEEAALFIRSGFKPWSLGQTVFRWETAALLCLGLLYWQKEKNRKAPGLENPEE